MKRTFALIALALVLSLGRAAAQDGRDIIPESVRAVNRALQWLAEHQNADGSWSGDVGFKLNQSYEVTADRVSHPGVTALAGIAFLSAGHLPGRGEYGDTIKRAMEYVLSCVNDEGHVVDHGTRMYSHAFATLFLAEVYGMTDAVNVKEPLQRAVNFIVGSQNGEGAWRYMPFAVDSDMSITVCQLNALRAARDVGIRVPKDTISNAADYVARSYVSSDDDYFLWQGEDYYDLGRGSFRYQATANTRSSFALTAAGLAALFNAGLHGETLPTRHGPIDLRASVEFLKDHYDWVSADSRWGFHYFYWYGHYYATQALYVVGGSAWEWYYPRIRNELVAHQRPDGSMPSRAGPGPEFATAVGALILALPYGYLPIFQR